MKTVLKGAEPPELSAFRAALPASTWQAMRDDAMHGGPNAYAACRSTAINNQCGLCAYCEIDIRDNDPMKCRIEHFHPKSDITPAKNWALDWSNLLAVCNGGSNPYVGGAGYFLAPIDKNLSCDQHKDRMIQAGRLAASCEGWILDPLAMPAVPSLFSLAKHSGELTPHDLHCAQTAIAGNRHGSTHELVQHTIDMLNLNCDRLAKSRLQIVRNIEAAKKRERQQGFNATDGLTNLVRRYFRTRWPGFFTTFLLCLEPAAGQHLHTQGYQG